MALPRDFLDKKNQAQLRSLVKDDRWDALMRYVDLKITRWRAEQVSGTNEFETLRHLHTRDGKVAGVLEIFENIERQALD